MLWGAIFTFTELDNLGFYNLEFFTNGKISSIILYLIPPPDPFSPLCGTPVSYLWDIVCLFALIYMRFFPTFQSFDCVKNLHTYINLEELFLTIFFLF